LNRPDAPGHPDDIAPDAAAPTKRAPARSHARSDGEHRLGARALVLVPVLPRGPQSARPGRADTPVDATATLHSPEDKLAEAVGLAEAIDLDVRDRTLVRLTSVRPSTLLGSGKVEEIGKLVEAEEVEVVIVDHAVSPVQQRNLEKAWACKVLDRTGLILEIFGRRARTREGRLQVELAHLSYQRTRLVRAWTHLERQRGGAGFLGGPGESQLELDRRIIQDRIDALKKELEQVVRTRELHRKGRRKVPYPIVAIVGYTNAGKSTLFNRITGAGVLAKDQVFATLDPTMREVRLASGRRVILSDTVGFISDLPTMLVAAFRATLEEVIEADLVLHVRDVSHAETEAQCRDVEKVLADLGVDPEAPETAILEVWNKIDLLDADQREVLAHSAERRPGGAVPVSAVTGEGLSELLAAIDTRLGVDDQTLDLELPAHAGRTLAWLHANAAILEREVDEVGTCRLSVRIDASKRGQLEALLRREGLRTG
jgi:GTP-binding protein HflX